MFINDTLFNSDTYYYYEDQRILVVMILIFFWVHTTESPTKSNLDTKQNLTLWPSKLRQLAVGQLVLQPLLISCLTSACQIHRNNQNRFLKKHSQNDKTPRLLFFSHNIKK